MLPPFIIEQIRRLEEEQRQRSGHDQPRLELPLEQYRPERDEPDERSDDRGERGVVILDIV